MCFAIAAAARVSLVMELGPVRVVVVRAARLRPGGCKGALERS